MFDKQYIPRKWKVVYKTSTFPIDTMIIRYQTRVRRGGVIQFLLFEIQKLKNLLLEINPKKGELGIFIAFLGHIFFEIFQKNQNISQRRKNF